MQTLKVHSIDIYIINLEAQPIRDRQWKSQGKLVMQNVKQECT